MKKVSLFAVILMLSVFCFGQQKSGAVLTFAENSFDFGTVKEDAGKITHEFEFTNTGDAPLVIQRVTASCGCTTPDWPKEPVAPGAKGKITVTYSTVARPGAFVKPVTIYSNATENPCTLTIKGTVSPSSKPVSLEEAYPQPLGPVRVKSFFAAFGTIKKGEARSYAYSILNNSDKPVTLEVANMPKYITAVIQPKEVASKQVATIIFTYNTALVNEPIGAYNVPVNLVINGDKNAAKTNKINLIANLVQ